MTAAVIVARGIAGAFFLMTALYALLASVPFSYQQFILPDVSPALKAFAAWHHVAFWLVASLIALTSIGDLRRRSARAATAALLTMLAAAGIWMSVTTPLPDLRPDPWSLAACVLSLTPILWAAAVDALAVRGCIRWADDDLGDDWRIGRAALLAALFVSLTYFAIGVSRASPPAMPAATLLVAGAWSVLSHLLVFGALCLVLLAVRAAVRSAGGSTAHESALMALAASAIGAVVLAQVAFRSISFTGPVALGVAFAMAASVTAMAAGAALRLRSRSNATVRTGLELLTAPLAAASATRVGAWGSLAALAAVAALAWLVSTRLSMVDWNHLAQKLSAVAFWIAAFATLYAMPVSRRRQPAGVMILVLLLAAAAPALAWRGLTAVEPRVPAWLGRPQLDIRGTLEAHAGLDASFKVIHDTLSSAGTTDDSGLYAFLQRNTNLPRDARIDPVPINLVDDLRPAAGPVPHIFLFVIDSLRQDYVSPYNAGVTFTPAIAAFARESEVFTRAFTRYGATGLSEPSIWTGAMLLHKQYVMPFAPMNALDKLLVVDRYQRFISRDSILRTILPARQDDVDLDDGVANMDYTLCGSLLDLRAKVLARADPGTPIFAYTQPQDIHISRMTREGETAGGAFDGFYRPYGERVEKMDACFGSFVQFLRDQDLYDNSIIALTSDHGDSLGEGGRWGHAYTIFPEILRIPLIVHLPEAMRARTTCDTDAVASLVDIAPTLYYLLGHRPLTGGEIVGRPLCTDTPEERIASRRASYLVASSYGPVYGVLKDNGNSLYVVDAVNYVDHYFDLTSDGGGKARQVSSDVRAENQPLIRAGVEAITRVYLPRGIR